MNGTYDEIGAKLKRDHLAALDAIRKQKRRLFGQHPEEYEDLLDRWAEMVEDAGPQARETAEPSER